MDDGGDHETERLGEVLEALGDDSTSTTLYRHELGSGRTFVGHVDLSGAQSPGEVLQLVRSRFGGGKYVLQVHKQPGWQYQKQATFSIAGRPKPLEGEEDPAAASPGEDRMARLERMVERLADQGGGGGAHGMMELAASMSGAMLAAITPLMSAVADQKAASGSELVRVLSKGIELGQLTAAKETGGPSDPYAGMFQALLERLPPAGASPNPAPAASNGAAAAAPAPAPEAGPPYLEALRPYLAELATVAASGRPAAEVAELVERLVAPVWLDELEGDPTAAHRIITACPELGAHRAWLLELLEALRSEEDEGGDQGKDEGAPIDEELAAT